MINHQNLKLKPYSNIFDENSVQIKINVNTSDEKESKETKSKAFEINNQNKIKEYDLEKNSKEIYKFNKLKKKKILYF